MTDIVKRIEDLQGQIDRASGGRKVLLLPITKTQPAHLIDELAQAGITQIGENRVQEWLEKKPKINKNFKLHMVGQLQSNKVRGIIEEVFLIHSVDRLSLLQEIQRQALKADRITDILFQVNIAGETQKGGVAPEMLGSLLDEAQKMSHIRMRGLMTIAPFYDDPELTRPVFAKARALFDSLSGQLPQFDTLSMGMSGDAMVAVSEGSTLVRIGSSIFGARPQI